MFGFFFRSPFGSCNKNLLKILNNELHFWCSSNCLCISFTHRFNTVHSAAYPVKYFYTSRCYLKKDIENIENFNSSKMIIKKDGSIEKKKKPVGVKVYLLNDKGISSSLFLQDAEKLAQRQKLQLKKVEEINGIAAYKLVAISDILENEIQAIKEDKKKKEKLKKLIINADIKSHDLQVKLNQINKFLEKGIKVFVKLSDNSNQTNKLDFIYSELEKSLAPYTISKQVSRTGYYVNISSKEKDKCNNGNS